MEIWQLKQLQSLPLEVKVEKTKKRICEWYEYWDGQVYVSFSGGKDSTVLLHIVRELYPDIPAVFCDTGLEYPEIRDFVKTIDNVIWLKPEMNFKEVIEKYGYPVISKAIADYACTAQKNPQSKTAKMLRGEFKSMFGGRGK
jgi:3'-phosphoadenosine 5'-phosphosulfate sulfotransferase (PAPS reductase)/FAD synthetase